ncbi:MAG: YciI family protein [Erythrobacter sp.]|uniref:YciI family protein n=1 Tax=Erythrobacter sp. TaxID=1042 RepID=UPI0026115FD7|nr:YciI family protein [Erythrobacter sp.]MDJ0977647.1 YciI family protein [Erythrobacter sp.]
MGLYAFYCRDGEAGPQLREKVLQDHLAHIEAHIEDYAVAGPLKQGDTTIGSLLVINADDEAEARAKFEADPYFTAGVWKSINATAFHGVAGDWVGGAAWKK